MRGGRELAAIIWQPASRKKRPAFQTGQTIHRFISTSTPGRRSLLISTSGSRTRRRSSIVTSGSRTPFPTVTSGVRVQFSPQSGPTQFRSHTVGDRQTPHNADNKLSPASRSAARHRNQWARLGVSVWFAMSLIGKPAYARLSPVSPSGAFFCAPRAVQPILRLGVELAGLPNGSPVRSASLGSGAGRQAQLYKFDGPKLSPASTGGLLVWTGRLQPSLSRPVDAAGLLVPSRSGHSLCGGFRPASPSYPP
jgi:hypothetical protein